MTYRGTVQGEVVVLDDGIRLPNGLAVIVEPVTSHPENNGVSAEPTIFRNGVPLLPRRAGGPTVDLEHVNRLRDELP